MPGRGASINKKLGWGWGVEGGCTRSVMAAPRARIALKAAWPGVSRKVSDCWLSGIFTSKAPICCTPPRACEYDVQVSGALRFK